METLRRNLKRLIDAADAGMPFDVAVVTFFMFRVEHIHKLYSLSPEQREGMLNSPPAASHHLRTGRSSAQRQKLIDIAIDPSNR